MQTQLLNLIQISLLALVLTACGGGGGNSDGGNHGGGNPGGGNDNQLSSIASQGANTDSVPITDPDGLVSDTEVLFGGPNDHPEEIGDNESLQDALNRLLSGG